MTASERENSRLPTSRGHAIAVLSPPLRHLQYGTCRHLCVATALTRGASAQSGRAAGDIQRRETIVKRMNIDHCRAGLREPRYSDAAAHAGGRRTGRQDVDQQIHRRRYARRRARLGPRRALFGGIIAGALIATAIREGRADDRDMRRCDRDFRGFDPRTRNVHRSLRRRAHLPVPALADRPHASTLLRRRLQDRRLIAFQDAYGASPQHVNLAPLSPHGVAE